MDIQSLLYPALGYILQTEDFLLHSIATGPGDCGTSDKTREAGGEDVVQYPAKKEDAVSLSTGTQKERCKFCGLKPHESQPGVPSKAFPLQQPQVISAPILTHPSRSPSPIRTYFQRSTPSGVQTVFYHKGRASQCRYNHVNHYVPRVPVKADTQEKPGTPLPLQKEVPRVKKSSVKVAYLRTGLPLSIPISDNSGDEGKYWWTEVMNETPELTSLPSSQYGQHALSDDVDYVSAVASLPLAEKAIDSQYLNIDQEIVDDARPAGDAVNGEMKNGVIVIDSSSCKSTPTVLRKTDLPARKPTPTAEKIASNEQSLQQTGKKAKMKIKGTRRKSRKDRVNRPAAPQKTNDNSDPMYYGDNERSASVTPTLHQKLENGKISVNTETKYQIRNVLSGTHQKKKSSTDGSPTPKDIMSGIRRDKKDVGSGTAVQSLARGSLRSLAPLSLQPNGILQGKHLSKIEQLGKFGGKANAPRKLVSRNTVSNLLVANTIAPMHASPQSAPVSPQRNKATQSSFSSKTTCVKCDSLPNVTARSEDGGVLIQTTSTSLPNVSIHRAQGLQIPNSPERPLLTVKNKTSSICSVTHFTQGSNINPPLPNERSQVTAVMSSTGAVSELKRDISPSQDIPTKSQGSSDNPITWPLPLSHKGPGNDGSPNSAEMSSLAGKGGRKEPTSNCCVETSNVLTELDTTNGDESESDSSLLGSALSSNEAALRLAGDAQIAVRKESMSRKVCPPGTVDGDPNPLACREWDKPKSYSLSHDIEPTDIEPEKQPIDDSAVVMAGKSSKLKPDAKTVKTCGVSESHKTDKDIASKRRYILQQILQSARQGESNMKESQTLRKDTEPISLRSNQAASGVATHSKDPDMPEISKYVPEDHKNGLRYPEPFSSVEHANNRSEPDTESSKKNLRLGRKVSSVILSRVDSISLGALPSELHSNGQGEEDDGKEKKMALSQDDDDKAVIIRDRSNDANSAQEKSDSLHKKNNRLSNTLLSVIKAARSHERHKVRELTAPKGSDSDDSYTFCFAERLGGSFEKWIKSSTSKVAVRKKMEILAAAELVDYSGRYEDVSTDGFSRESESSLLAGDGVPVEKEIAPQMRPSVNTAADDQVAFTRVPSLGLPVLDDRISPGASLEDETRMSGELTTNRLDFGVAQADVQRNDGVLGNFASPQNQRRSKNIVIRNPNERKEQNETVAHESQDDNDSKNKEYDQSQSNMLSSNNITKIQHDHAILSNRSSPQKQVDKVETSPIATKSKPCGATSTTTDDAGLNKKIGETITVNIVTRSDSQPPVMPGFRDNAVKPAVNAKEIRALVPCRKELQIVGLTSKEMQVAFANKNNIKQSFANHIKQSFPANSRVLAKINQLPLHWSNRMLEKLYLEPQVSKLNQSIKSDADCMLSKFDQTIRLTPHFPYIIGLPVHSEVLQLAMKLEELSAQSEDQFDMKPGVQDNNMQPKNFVSLEEIIRRVDEDMYGVDTHVQTHGTNSNVENNENVKNYSESKSDKSLLCESSESRSAERNTLVEPGPYETDNAADVQANEQTSSPLLDKETQTDISPNFGTPKNSLALGPQFEHYGQSESKQLECRQPQKNDKEGQAMASFESSDRLSHRRLDRSNPFRQSLGRMSSKQRYRANPLTQASSLPNICTQLQSPYQSEHSEPSLPFQQRSRAPPSHHPETSPPRCRTPSPSRPGLYFWSETTSSPVKRVHASPKLEPGGSSGSSPSLPHRLHPEEISTYHQPTPSGQDQVLPQEQQLHTENPRQSSRLSSPPGSFQVKECLGGFPLLKPKPPSHSTELNPHHSHLHPITSNELNRPHLHLGQQCDLEKPHQTNGPQLRLHAHAQPAPPPKEQPKQTIQANKLHVGSSIRKREPENNLKQKLDANGISKQKSKNIF